MKRSWQITCMSEQGDEQIGAKCAPDLDADTVLAEREERVDLEMLFDPLEEEFHLPAVAVDQGDHAGFQRKVVGQENQGAFCFGIFVADSADKMRVGLSSFARTKAHELVASDSWLTGAVVGPDDVGPKVAFEPGDKVGLLEVKRLQALQVDVPAINHIVAAWIHGYLVEGEHVAVCGLFQTGKSGDVSSQIQQEIELHRRLGTLPLCPRKELQAQIDDRGVQSEQVAIKIDRKVHRLIRPARTLHQKRSQVGKQAPIAILVCIGDVGPCGPSTDSTVVKQRLSGTQTHLKIPKALPKRELGEDHRCEVVVGGKCGSIPPHRVSNRNPLKLLAADRIQKLSQNRPAMVHAPADETRRGERESRKIRNPIFLAYRMHRYLKIQIDDMPSDT